MKKRRLVTAFSGLDERKSFGEDLSFSPDMRNFRVTENRTLAKRYGISPVCPVSGAVTGMWSGFLGSVRYFLFTSGGKLYRLFPETSETIELGSVGAGENVLFEFRSAVYIKNQNQYSRYDGESLSVVSGYAPLIAVGCSPDGSGTPFEELNMLTGTRRVLFSCDDVSTVYQLPEKDLNSVISVRLGGVPCPISWHASLSQGKITFDGPPVGGLNNLEVTYNKTGNRREVILKASGVMLFGGDTDGHVFLWGNPDYPAYRFHSELADGQPSAEYFPENHYTVIGDSGITDIVEQYDRQLIFTKDRAYYSYREMKTDTQGELYASFPVYNLNGEKGSLLKNAGCIMENEPVTLCQDGLNRWSSTSVENEKNAVCFSAPVGETLRSWIAGGNFGEMRLFNLRAGGELYFLYRGTALIYNYRLGVWYAYDQFGADKLCEYGGTLYFSDGNGIEFLDTEANYDTDGRFTAYWETPECPLGFPGANKKLTELGLTLKAFATPILDFSFSGDGEGTAPPVTRLEYYFGDGGTESFSFRPPLHRLSAVKLRLTEYDYAHCEICALHIDAVQKGRYGRKGL